MKITLLVLLCLCVFFLSESVQARGRGGGRGRSSSGSSSRRSGSSRSGSCSARRMKYGPYKTRVTKTTYIPVRTRTSPVIVRQTTRPTRTHLGTRMFVGYMIYRHALHGNGPIYRERYPLYRGEVTIPEERAIRVNFTEEKMLDSNGSVCLGPNDKRNVIPDYYKRIVLVITEVRYGGSDGKSINYFGDNRTLSLHQAELDQSVQVYTVVKYNGSIIENTNCTQMTSVMNGTVIRLYATNPDKAGTMTSSFLVVLLSCIVYFVYMLD